MTSRERQVVDAFHELYYNGLTGDGPIYMRTTWMNVPCLKCPLDLWIYQEIMAEIRPDLIVETGTYDGGSALFMAQMLDIIGKGEVISIDIRADRPRPAHRRLRYVQGSSADRDLISSILDSRPPETRMVILDSDHSMHHVLTEMNLLSPYVSVGSYLIIEDTNVNGHPTFRSHGDGPFEAMTQFLSQNSHFVANESREKFLMTFNPRGYLKRIR